MQLKVKFMVFQLSVFIKFHIKHNGLQSYSKFASYILGWSECHVIFLLCSSKVTDSYKNKNSINNVLLIYFDDLSSSFNKVHNSTLVEQPVFRSEKLYQMMIYSLVGIECFMILGILHKPKKLQTKDARSDEYDGWGNTL